MGYGSVFNGAAIIPHLDALQREGVAADMYSYRFCSPTRASFLTGRFPWRVSSTICDNRVCNYLPATVPMGVHLGFSMLPQRLQQEKGYVTYHVGKWHEVRWGLGAPAWRGPALPTPLTPTAPHRTPTRRACTRLNSRPCTGASTAAMAF